MQKFQKLEILNEKDLNNHLLKSFNNLLASEFQSEISENPDEKARIKLTI